ncbi:hypothetical protein R1sor_010289 [Riccia sorocarpa]|uniref:PHD-type domain-containing protein n=1 Tax=Riccia sorocarpa TaxID=122646 RepID=A0ABD3HXK3_9MARC
MARTAARAVRVLEPSTSWRLDVFFTGRVDSKPLQGWRSLGNGDGDQKSRREQIIECIRLLDEKDLVSNDPDPDEDADKDQAMGNPEDIIMKSDEGTDGGAGPTEIDRIGSVLPAVTSPENMIAAAGHSSSSRSGSEFKNADSWISVPGENLKEEECVQSRPIPFPEKTETEAYAFEIFNSDDLEERKPVSVFDLAFSEKETEEYPLKLILMASASRQSPMTKYMLTIDSWTIRADDGKRLLVYVRSVDGAWCKLCTAANSYNAVFEEWRIVVGYLEIAVKFGSKLKKPHTYFSKLHKLYEVEKSKIRDVLKKYYISVVQKFVYKGGIPELKDAQIIRNMKEALKLSTGKPNMPPSKIHKNGGQKKVSSPKKAMSKRKRVVLSCSEDESEVGTDSEDLKPLLQRNFKRKKKMKRTEQQSKEPKRWRSGSSLLERKEERDAADTIHVAATAKDTVEVSRDNYRGEGSKDVERPGFAEATPLFKAEDEHEELDSDDEDVGDAAVCTICDDGGDLLFCDGPCGRSFHASQEAVMDSGCSSLGMKPEEVKETGSWLCPNCKYSRHQCFICGSLGDSEGESKEVFLCVVALCGRFYHPRCLGEFLAMGKNDIATFCARIKVGTESVFCPAHKCRVCEKGEEGGPDNSKKLAKCRRCPSSFHKICLPPSISFDGTDEQPVRAWEIGDNIIIYCTNHEIEEDLNTPKRDHLKWPEEYQGIRRRAVSPSRYEHKAKSFVGQTRGLKGEDLSSRARSSIPVKQKVIQKKPEVKKISSKLLQTDGFSFPRKELPGPSKMANSVPLKPDAVKGPVQSVLKRPSKEALLKRVTELRETSAAAVTVESVQNTLFLPSNYTLNQKKIMRRGELLSIFNAAKLASEMVMAGKHEEARRICPRANFLALARSEDALRVYLAPLLHGARYTSYGRHFTNPDKLKEIIERIHWYIDDGDMVVDFCCGSNDFSTLLKEKLDSVGKKCHYRNFDIHPPKNTFAFTKRDWFETKGEGFAEGRKLVMGLNPPFGTRAALATKFVLHALSFRPKLLVLIVPPETMDYGRKFEEVNYSLIWEDKELLSGKSFYLPGTLHKTDDTNLSGWNLTTPPLYLWCPTELLRKNQQIAARHKHIQVFPTCAPDLRAREPSPTGARDFIGGQRLPSVGRSQSPLSETGPSFLPQRSTQAQRINPFEGPGFTNHVGVAHLHHQVGLGLPPLPPLNQNSGLATGWTLGQPPAHNHVSTQGMPGHPNHYFAHHAYGLPAGLASGEFLRGGGGGENFGRALHPPLSPLPPGPPPLPPGPPPLPPGRPPFPPGPPPGMGGMGTRGHSYFGTGGWIDD